MWVRRLPGVSWNGGRQTLDSTGSSDGSYRGDRRLVHVDLADTDTRCGSFTAFFDCRHPGIANTVGVRGHHLQPMWVLIEHNIATESNDHARHPYRRTPDRLQRRT
jgi:hypothetical protein